MSFGLMSMNTQRQQQMASQAAQELAADLRRMASESIKSETYTYIVTTANGYTIYKIPSTYSWVPGGWTILKSKNFVQEYGSVIFSYGGSTKVPIGPRGWPLKHSGVPFFEDNPVDAQGNRAAPNLDNTAVLQATDGKGEHYMWTCSSGTAAGLKPFTVKLYVNGRITTAQSP